MAKKHRTGTIYKRGAQFWLKYVVDGRRIRQSLQTDNLAEAEEKRKAIMRPLATAERVDALAITAARLSEAKSEASRADETVNPALAVEQVWPAYEEATNRPDSSERTLAGYESAWKRFKGWLTTERPAIRAMRDIDATVAAAYAQQLTADGVTASTFNQHIGLLRLVWRCLEKPIRGTGNPWLMIQKKRLQKLAHRHKAITQVQFDNLLKASESADLHDLLCVLGWTGQRLVDAVMLRWDAINFAQHVITIYPRKTARTGKAVHIPLLVPLADLLQNRKRMVDAETVFPELAADYDRDPSSLVKRIQATFESAGLTPREKRPGIARAVTSYGAHSFRHYYATQALAAGIPAEIVKRITGHTSDAMLANYEHVDAGMIGGLAARLSNGRQALPEPTEPSLRAQVGKLAEALTSKNWKTVKKALQTLAVG